MAERVLKVSIAEDSSGWKRFVSSGDDALGQLGEKMKGFAGVAAAAFAAAGAAAGAALVAGTLTAIDQGATSDKFAARLALDPAEAERLGKIAGDIYAGAWGESFEEVNLALEGVVKNFGEGLSDADLEGLTTQVLDVATAFDLDVNEAIRATSSLLRTGLAGDAEEALDIVTLGLQTAGGESGDLLDSLTEYSEQFASLGIDGQTATRMLVAGFDAGAFSIDKVGDAVKEFSIRAIDGSEATSKAFSDLGFDAEDMAQKFANGGPAAEEAMGQVITALSGVGDKVKQDEMGVALFGSMWEDVGPDVIAAINPIGQEIEDISDRTEDMGAVLNDNLATRLEELKRTAQQKLAEFAGAFVEAFDTIVQTWKSGGFSAVLDLIGAKIAELAPVVREKLKDAAAALWQWVQDAVPPALAALGDLISRALQWLSSDGIPALRSKMREFLPLLSQWIQDAIPVVGEKLVELGVAFVKWVADVLPPLLLELGKLLVEIKVWIYTDLIPSVVEGMVELAAKFVAWAADVLRDLPAELAKVLSAIVGWLTGQVVPAIVTGASNAATAFLGWVVSVVTQLPGKLAEVAGQITGWLAGLVTTVATKAVEMYAAYIKWIADAIRLAPTLLASIATAIFNWATTIPGKILDGIGDLATALWNKIKDAFWAAVNWAKERLSFNLGSLFKFNLPFFGGGGGTIAPGVGAGAGKIEQKSSPPVVYYPSGGDVVPLGPQVHPDGHRLAALLPGEVVVNPANPARGMRALARTGLLGGGGGTTIQVHVNAGHVASPTQVRDYVIDAIRDAVRLNPGVLTP